MSILISLQADRQTYTCTVTSLTMTQESLIKRSSVRGRKLLFRSNILHVTADEWTTKIYLSHHITKCNSFIFIALCYSVRSRSSTFKSRLFHRTVNSTTTQLNRKQATEYVCALVINRISYKRKFDQQSKYHFKMVEIICCLSGLILHMI